MKNTYKAPIYKAVVFSFGVMLAGQYARYAAHALDLLPEPETVILVAPYPVKKPTLMTAALDNRPSCEGDARQPMFLPCGFDAPIPTEKPRG